MIVVCKKRERNASFCQWFQMIAWTWFFESKLFDLNFIKQVLEDTLKQVDKIIFFKPENIESRLLSHNIDWFTKLVIGGIGQLMIKPDTELFDEYSENDIEPAGLDIDNIAVGAIESIYKLDSKKIFSSN